MTTSFPGDYTSVRAVPIADFRFAICDLRMGAVRGGAISAHGRSVLVRDSGFQCMALDFSARTPSAVRGGAFAVRVQPYAVSAGSFNSARTVDFSARRSISVCGRRPQCVEGRLRCAYSRTPCVESRFQCTDSRLQCAQGRFRARTADVDARRVRFSAQLGLAEFCEHLSTRQSPIANRQSPIGLSRVGGQRKLRTGRFYRSTRHRQIRRQ
jgi:hypothetical protein